MNARKQLVTTVVTGILLAVPGASGAQEWRWDVAAHAGALYGRTPPDPPSRYPDRWYRVGEAALVIGRYITPHVKVEIDASLTGEGSQYAEVLVAVPALPHLVPIAAEMRRSFRTIGGAVTWQFLDNQWVHPFVQAGVSSAFEQLRIRSYRHRVYAGIPGQSPLVDVGEDGVTESNATRALGFVGAGAKFYVSPRVFIRGDGRFAFGTDRQSVGVRAGIGVDF